MEIVVVGVNHKKAPVELREKLAFDARALGGALDAMRSAARSSEEVILSTCNRVELYFVREDAQPDALESAAQFLSRERGQPVESVRPILYRHEGAEAVRHLFEVASSLDSMVVGETQIIAQVKQAYFAAKEAGHTGRVLNPLFQRALAVAKRVHSATGIGGRSVTVPSVAARLAEKIFQELADKRLLILGAGETGALTLDVFRERGVRDVLVVNRSPDAARMLAERVGGTGHGLDELAAALPRADLVIACLSAPEVVVRTRDVQSALRARRNEPMVFIDLGVPRNVEADVQRLDNVYLFNIDDLQGIVNQNLLEREQEAAACAPLIASEAQEAMRELAVIDVQGVLTALRSSFEAIGDEELKRTVAKLQGLTAEQREEVEELVRRLLNKLLHAPTTSLREEAGNGRGSTLAELAARMFKLK